MSAAEMGTQTILFYSALAGTWLFSLISFSILASDHLSYHSFKRSYTDSTALSFGVAAGVLVWLASMALGAAFVATRVMLLEDPSKSHKKAVQATVGFMLLFSYSAAVAIASVGADCEDDDLDDDTTFSKKLRAFCAKINASCAFMWFTVVCTLVLAALELRRTDNQLSMNSEYTATSPMEHDEGSAFPPLDHQSFPNKGSEPGGASAGGGIPSSADL